MSEKTYSNFNDLVPLETTICNVIRNDFPEFTELVYYKHPFKITTGNFVGIDNLTGEVLIKGQNIDRTRNFIENNGVLEPLKDNVLIYKAQRSIINSRKRALDNMYGYVLSNTWSYFLTLTFDPNLIDRDNEESIKYAYKLFRQKLQYLCKSVKIFAVPERHPKSGKLHFHVLLGDIDLTSYLTRAINPKNNKKIYSKGRAVYNLDLFEFGFSTVVKTDSDSLKVANYLTKYITKDFGNIGYNKKAYYHTNNLFFKNKEFAYITEDCNIYKEIMSDNFICEKYKETDDLIIYRYKLPFKE